MKKTLTVLITLFAMSIGFSACGGDDPVLVTSVTFNKTTLALEVGAKDTLTASIAPSDAANTNIAWSSDKPAVATVSQSGEVTAVASGIAIITVTTEDGGKTATCEVKVTGVLINGIVWATSNIDMPETFAANPESFGMFYQWGRIVGWSADDPLVNSNGGTVWSNTNVDGTIWETANDPSPAGWRVPSLEECQSLLDEAKVTSEWTTQNGVAGRRFTDKTTGANIFLSAVGNRYMTGEQQSRGISGYYWTSTAGTNALAAHEMYFNSSEQNTVAPYKSHGFSVRSVAE